MRASFSRLDVLMVGIHVETLKMTLRREALVECLTGTSGYWMTASALWKCDSVSTSAHAP